MTQTPTPGSVPDDVAASAPDPVDGSAEATAVSDAPDAPEAEEAVTEDEAAPADEVASADEVAPADEVASADAVVEDPAVEVLVEETVVDVVDVVDGAVVEDVVVVEEVALVEDGVVVDEVTVVEETVLVDGDVVADDVVVIDEAQADVDEVPADEAAPADDEPEAAAPAARAPRPTPAPRPSPRPRPVPHPPTHAAPTSAAVAAPAPVAPPQDAAEAAIAATFGTVDDEGTVSVREAAGERVVGQFPGATKDEALALYVRRFLDLQAKVALFEARLGATDLSVKEIDQTLAKLTEELAEPAAVGDLDGVRARLEALRVTAAERRAVAEAERAAAREAAVVARTQIVEQAEKIAGTDPARIQWRPAGEQLRVLLDQWKDAQRSGPRLDRPTEEALWKRFSHARTTFDRERRHFFAELETRNASAKQVKESLVAEAERLQSSTDWGTTAGIFRDLMVQWKSAGRASRADDDALWARFRAAQDAFFAARDAQTAATDEEFRANLEVKEALLAEAESLVPVTNLAAAKQALNRIQDRWEAAGKVPRGDVQRIEARLRAVEATVRDSDQAQWRRTNPETRARAEGAAAQLEQAIAGLEADLAKAKSAGDARKIADAQAALDARRAWLEQVQRAAQDARG